MSFRFLSISLIIVGVVVAVLKLELSFMDKLKSECLNCVCFSGFSFF